MSSLEEQLRVQLMQSLSPVKLVLRDDSAAHAGHVGAREGAHFSAHIVAECFRGLRTLERHRLVYAAAAPLLGKQIHALQLRTEVPADSKEAP
jgi:BolA protein